MWLGLQKQGMWVHDFCLFFQIFITHNFCTIYIYYGNVILSLSKYLISLMMQFTSYRMQIFSFSTEI